MPLSATPSFPPSPANTVDGACLANALVHFARHECNISACLFQLNLIKPDLGIRKMCGTLAILLLYLEKNDPSCDKRVVIDEIKL